MPNVLADRLAELDEAEARVAAKPAKAPGGNGDVLAGRLAELDRLPPVMTGMDWAPGAHVKPTMPPAPVAAAPMAVPSVAGLPATAPTLQPTRQDPASPFFATAEGRAHEKEALRQDELQRAAARAVPAPLKSEYLTEKPTPRTAPMQGLGAPTRESAPSPELYEQPAPTDDPRGRVGVIEAIGKRFEQNPLAVVPIVSTIFDYGRAVALAGSVSTITEHEAKYNTPELRMQLLHEQQAEAGLAHLSPYQKRLDAARQTLADAIVDLYDREVRGYSVGGQIAEGVIALLPYMGEFMATAGAVTVAKAGVQKAAAHFLGKYATTAVGKAATAVAGVAAGATLRTATVGLPRIGEQYVGGVTGIPVGYDSEGKLIVVGKQAPAKALYRAIGDTWIEYFSEETGAVFGMAGRGVGRTVLAKVPGAAAYFSKLSAALSKALPKSKALSAVIKKGGYDGLVGELGEERIGDIMRSVTGVQDIPIMRALWPGTDQMLAELGVLSVPGAVGMVGGVVSSKLERAGLKREVRAEVMAGLDPAARAEAGLGLAGMPGVGPIAPVPSISIAGGPAIPPVTGGVPDLMAALPVARVPRAVEPPMPVEAPPRVGPAGVVPEVQPPSIVDREIAKPKPTAAAPGAVAGPPVEDRPTLEQAEAAKADLSELADTPHKAKMTRADVAALKMIAARDPLSYPIARATDFAAGHPDAGPAEIVGVLLRRSDINAETITTDDILEADELVRKWGFSSSAHLIEWLTGKNPNAIEARRIQESQEHLRQLFERASGQPAEAAPEAPAAPPVAKRPAEGVTAAPRGEAAPAKPAEAVAAPPAEAEGREPTVRQMRREDKAFAKEKYGKTIARATEGRWRNAEEAGRLGPLAGIPVRQAIRDLRNAGYSDKDVEGYLKRSYGLLEVVGEMSRLGSKEFDEAQQAGPPSAGVAPAPTEQAQGLAEAAKPTKRKLPSKITGWHTLTAESTGGKGAAMGFSQRGPGSYIALDKPFQPGLGEVMRASVDLSFDEILDPRDLMKGTDVEKSRKDWKAGIDRVNAMSNEEVKALGGNWKALQAVYKQMGYKAEVGEIEPGHPDEGRELVVWDRESVRLSKQETEGATRISETEAEAGREPGGADLRREGQVEGRAVAPSEVAQALRQFEASTFKNAQDRSLAISQMRADALRNLTKAHPGLAKGYGGLDVPAKRIVKSAVLDMIENDDVFRSVVASIPIDVMDIFIGKKGASDLVLGDKSVFSDTLASAPNNEVTGFVIDAAMGLPTSDRAKVDLLRLARGAPESGAAVPARDIVALGEGGTSLTAEAGGGLRGISRARLEEGSAPLTESRGRLHGPKDTTKAQVEQEKTAPQVAEPLGSEAYVTARKYPDGHYKLFYRGTRNEVFPGEKFKSAQEARGYFRAMKVKQEQAAAAPAPVKPAAPTEYTAADIRAMLSGLPDPSLAKTVREVLRNEGPAAAGLVAAMARKNIGSVDTHATDKVVMIQVADLSEENADAVIKAGGSYVRVSEPRPGQNFVLIPTKAARAVAESLQSQDIGDDEMTLHEEVYAAAEPVEVTPAELRRMFASEGAGKPAPPAEAARPAEAAVAEAVVPWRVQPAPKGYDPELTAAQEIEKGQWAIFVKDPATRRSVLVAGPLTAEERGPAFRKFRYPDADLTEAAPTEVEPWQMTQAEYLATAMRNPRGQSREQKQLRRRALEEHEAAVAQAVMDGKLVPPPVLAEYASRGAGWAQEAAAPGKPAPVAEKPVAKAKPAGETVASGRSGAVQLVDADTVASAATNVMPMARAPATTAPPVSITEIVQAMQDGFGIPLRVGRFRSPGAHGIYKRLWKVARNKDFANIGVWSHEVSHHAYYEEKLWNLMPTAVQDELKAMDYEPDKNRLHEGFAEFGRLFLTNPTAAASVAPVTSAWFADVYLRTSRFANAFLTAKEKIDTLRLQGSLARVRTQIDRQSARWSNLRAIVRSPVASVGKAWRRMIQHFADRYDPLWRAQAEITGGRFRNLDDLLNVPAQYWFAPAAKVANMTAGAKARQAVLTGMIDFTGSRVGPGLQEILAPIADSFRIIDGVLDFEAYCYALHAIDVHAAGKNPGIALEDAKEVVKELGSRPGWREAAKGVTKWHDGLLDYLGEAGGISPEGIAKMRATYPNYIPLLRSMEQAQAGMGAGGRKLANLPSAIKRLKGSGRPIVDPLESSIQYAERIIGIADKIRVGRMLVDAAIKYKQVGPGRLVEPVPPQAMPVTMDIGSIKKQLEAAGVDLADADLEATLVVFHNAYRPDTKDNIVLFWREGKLAAYQVSPDIYLAITGVDAHYQLPKILDWLFGVPARMVRLGATGLRAGFSLITNPLRDTMTAAMQTRTKGLTSSVPAIAARNLVGILDDIAGTEVARLFKAGGGEMAQPLGIDRTFTQEAVNELLAISPKDKVLNWAEHPAVSLRRFLSVPELGPRIAEFEAILKDMGWKPGQKLTLQQYLIAQMAAANVTVDFRSGGSTAMWLNRVVAFHNASLQGPRRMFEAFRNRPVSTLLRALVGITLPTIALWWAYKDDDWYKELPAWEKARYWHLKLPGGAILRVPKPFEWGMVFGSMVESGLQSLYDSDPTALRKSAGETLDAMVPPIMPTALGPIVDVYANKDSFRGTPIVPRRLEGLEARDQYTSYTTETAKTVGRLFNVSPAQVDYLLSNYTGGLASDIARGGEYTARAVGVMPEKKERERQLKDIPVVGRLFVRPDTTQVFDDFYSAMDSLGRKAQSAKVRKETLGPDEQRHLRRLAATSRLMADMRKQERDIAESDLPDDQRWAEAVKTRKHMIVIAKATLRSKGPAWSLPMTDATTARLLIADLYHQRAAGGDEAKLEAQIADMVAQADGIGLPGNKLMRAARGQVAGDYTGMFNDAMDAGDSAAATRYANSREAIGVPFGEQAASWVKRLDDQKVKGLDPAKYDRLMAAGKKVLLDAQREQAIK